MHYEEFKFEDIEVGDELQWKKPSGGSSVFVYGQCYKVLSIDGFITIDNNGVATLVNGGDINWNLIKLNNTASKIATLPKVQSLPPFKNMKFRVENEKHSKQIQEYLFSIGYRWSIYGTDLRNEPSAEHIFTNLAGIIGWSNLSWLQNDRYKEYKLISHTTYSIEPVEKELVEILGKQYNKSDVEELLKTLEEVK